jgi:hypothetical protein
MVRAAVGRRNKFSPARLTQPGRGDLNEAPDYAVMAFSSIVR